METPKPDKVWRHAATIAHNFGQNESIQLSLTFDDVDQFKAMLAQIDKDVFEPRQKDVEKKIDEINKKIRDAAEKGNK